ncbi:hypothetical protein SE16_09905 [Ardenticatena maritima]|uniref:Uncharacterized protein n=1 Tax=Ardenticatena maritima TaxID=872965 RepID=A0A0N8GRZ2_9CHLR|nr:hypothetical protein SE16_09905 [Ardenticatena maritima]
MPLRALLVFVNFQAPYCGRVWMGCKWTSKARQLHLTAGMRGIYFFDAPHIPRGGIFDKKTP